MADDSCFNIKIILKNDFGSYDIFFTNLVTKKQKSFSYIGKENSFFISDVAVVDINGVITKVFKEQVYYPVLDSQNIPNF